MINIDKTFSRRLAVVIKKLPSILACLSRLDAAGIKVKMKPNFHGAYYEAKRRTIYLGELGSIRFKLYSLSHEEVHAIGKPTQDPVAGKDVRGPWADKQCRNEAHATIAEIPVIRELQKLGHKFTRRELVFLHAFNRGGFKAVLQQIRQSVSSTTGEAYPLYYRLWFDEIKHDHEKHCGPWSKKCQRGIDHKKNLDNQDLYSNRAFKEYDDGF